MCNLLHRGEPAKQEEKRRGGPQRGSSKWAAPETAPVTIAGQQGKGRRVIEAAGLSACRASWAEE